jgi:hypothetical protein
MPRKLPEVTAFGAELLQALTEGSRREIILEMPYREAVYNRQRLNLLRARMREDNHPLAKLVQNARITIEWDPEVLVKTSSRGVRFPRDTESLVRLRIQPQDRKLREALNQVGIKVNEPEETAALVPEAVEDPEQVLADYLTSRSKKDAGS